MNSEPMLNHRLTRYTWGVLVFNVLVILWGAVVRATGSGAGCGAHWPTCNGEVLPAGEELSTAIEFSHRLTSGLAFLLVIILFFWVRSRYPAQSSVRTGAAASLIFMIGEVLIGAVLVLFSLTASNTSVARAAVIALHLVNTFLLLAALTLTAWWASGGASLRLRGRSGLWSTGLAAGALMILGASGAVTALGDTLLLNAGISPDESVLLATLIELRISHPLIALVTGALIWLAVRRGHRSLGLISVPSLLSLYFLQFLLGGLNVYLRAPIWLQILHLLLSDLIWILFVLLIAHRFARPADGKTSYTPLDAKLTLSAD